MKKILIVLVLIAVLGFVGVVTSIYVGRNIWVKQIIERGGEYALGVTTVVHEVDLQPKEGSLDLAELKVANPEGFERADYIAEVRTASFKIQPATVMEDLIVIDHIQVDGVGLNLELNGTTPNFQPIIDHLEKITASEDGGESDGKVGGESSKDPAAKEKLVKIGQVRLTGLVVTLRMDNIDGSVGERVLKLPDFEVTDIGEPDGIAVSEVQGVLTKAVMQHVQASAGDYLPQVMVQSLAAGVENLAGLGNVTVEALGDGVEVVGDELGKAVEQANKVFAELGKHAGQAAEEAMKAADGAVKGASDAADEAMKGATEGVDKALKGLFGQ